MSWFRETFAGRTINILSRDRLLTPPEIPAHLEAVENRTLTRHLALARTISRHSVASDPSVLAEIEEKGARAELVEFQPDDADNPHNWSDVKKCFVTGTVYFLTTAVYIGSAIYTTGTEDIDRQFHISSVVSTLGLSLFVFGYGLGPMFLAPFVRRSFIPTKKCGPFTLTCCLG